MSDQVRTRFAPSPTGYLHIGGARTALFNYLLARRLGGTFIIRVEDTDQTRNIAGAEDKLLDDMRWLGLDWDEGPRVGGDFGPYHQSQRLQRYQAAARQLLDAGRAYYAFDTREELDELRTAAEKAGGSFYYPRPDRFPSEADAERARAEGRPVVLRFLYPDEDITVRDEILGDVTVPRSEVDDFVILKADGFPTYHFAVVVDDEDMRITHVLRGQEHLINTPKHIALQRALGYRTPAFAHLPVILAAGGSKMSKREKDKTVRDAVRDAVAAGTLDEARVLELSGVADAEQLKRWRKKKIQLDADGLERLAAALQLDLPEIDIHDFRRSGYLPEVILNYIALLGWSPADGRERMTLAEMAGQFDLSRVGKTNARFDRDKLLSFNTDTVNADPERALAGLKDYLAVNPASPLQGVDEATLRTLLEINAGYRTYRDIEHKCAALFVEDEALAWDDKAVEKVLRKGDKAGVTQLAAVRPALADLADWSPEGLETALKQYAEQNGVGFGKVAQPLRVALTGSMISPPIFHTLSLLGKETCLRRVDAVVARET